MKRPKVSVCIPTYNRANYLKESIHSVINQSFQDFELVISDNASTDNTKEIVDSFRGEALRYHRNRENLGAIGNLNRCIELAQGEYVTIFHDDDVMFPCNLEKKAKLLDKNSNVGLVHSNVHTIDGNGKIINELWTKDHTKDFIIDGFSCFEKLVLGFDFICCPSVMVKKECYDKVGVFDLRIPYSCDYEMWMRIALYYDIAYLSEPLIKYRWHKDNDTHKYTVSLKAIKQDYLARIIVVEKNKEKFLNAKFLLNKIRKSVSKISLEWANRNFCKSLNMLALKQLLFSYKLNPSIVKDHEFFPLFVRIIIGNRGRSFARKVKKIFKNFPHENF